MNKGINVLSLFDGISCGQIALERAGIKVDKYYASEIDKNAIKVTQHNWQDTIQLGDVTKVQGENLPKIDLLIAGSPCQGFSFAGKQLNFEDSRSKLFFEFVRLLEEKKPKYFLLENVRMKQEHQDIITSYLKVKPITINSSLLSAQSRNRFYWTNIPNIKQPEDQKITFKNVAEVISHPLSVLSDAEVTCQLKQLLLTSKYKDNFLWKRDKNGRILVMRPDKLKIQRIGRIANFNTKTEIITCLTQPFVNDGEKLRKITPLEAERLQTVPDNYTSCISDNKRYHALGNGWTVDVIAHIFSSLPQEFKNG